MSKKKMPCFPLEEFFEAYYDCRRKKRSTANEQIYEMDYSNSTVQLWRDVKNREYKIGRSITFVISRPRPREIFAADFRDRIVHHLVMNRLDRYFEDAFIDDNYNCRIGKGVLYGVNSLANKIQVASENYTRKDLYVAKFDLKGFFMSIHKPTLWKLLEEFIKETYHGEYKECLLYLCKEIVLHKPQENCIRQSHLEAWDMLGPSKTLFKSDPDCGLPIGNLTSQCFANFYLHRFDNLMKKKFPLGYGRYVDDFYVIARSKEEIMKMVPIIKRYLQMTLKVKLHENKIYIQHYTKGICFIGSFVKMQRIYAGKDMVTRIYRKLKWIRSLDIEEKANIDKVEKTINSYLGLLRHATEYKLRRTIIDLMGWKWRTVFIVSKNCEKITPKKCYKVLEIAKNDVKHGKIGKYLECSAELLGESIE